MQSSTYIIEREPLKYGGYQEDYQLRMQAVIAWGLRQIKETPKDEKALVKLFFHLMESFMEERKKIACDHRTIKAEQFGRRRDEEVGTKDFYHTILDGNYKEYNPKILSVFAKYLRQMSLENKQTSQKHKKIEEIFLDRRSSFEIEILEQEDLVALQPSELPADFPLHLMNKRNAQDNVSIEECKMWKKALKKLKDEHPVLYKRLKMTNLIMELHTQFPSPKPIPSPTGIQFIGNEANRKSFFAFATARLQVNEKLYATTQYLTWLYRDFITHPVDRMLKCSTVMVIHQDNFLIDVTLQEIAIIFAKCILSNQKDQNELEQNTGLLRHYFANNMPCERGSASIGEMFEGSIYSALDLKVLYNSEKQIDLEALTSPLLSLFMQNYKSMRVLQPIHSN